MKFLAQHLQQLFYPPFKNRLIHIQNIPLSPLYHLSSSPIIRFEKAQAHPYSSKNTQYIFPLPSLIQMGNHFNDIFNQNMYYIFY